MSDNELSVIVDEIYFEIEKRNSRTDDKSIPLSIDLFPYLTEKFKLDESKIPGLIGILVNSHKIFNFDIVKEDKTAGVECIYGFVAAEMTIVNSLARQYEKELIRVYFEEFQKHLPSQKLIDELKLTISRHNNTPLGKYGNIAINLSEYEELLKKDYVYAREARQYSPEWKQKQLKKEIELAGPVSSYLKQVTSPEKKEEKKSLSKGPVEKKRRQLDNIKNADAVVNSLKNSMEKNLAAYGLEFYTRVCFREYKFQLMIKVVEEGLIKSRDEMLTLSKLIRKLRSHADKDADLFKYANDINRLEKLVNEKLK